MLFAMYQIILDFRDAPNAFRDVPNAFRIVLDDFRDAPNAFRDAPNTGIDFHRMFAHLQRLITDIRWRKYLISYQMPVTKIQF
jgi:hypothetical protein